MTTPSTNISTRYTQIYDSYDDNGHINFLALLIIRNTSKLEIDIYMKPTTTNTAINHTSNHPTEHKIAAYRPYITRMKSLPLTTERQRTEWNTIKAIAQSNNFPDKFITKLKSQIKQKHTKHRTRKQTKRTKTKNGQSSHTTAQE